MPVKMCLIYSVCVLLTGLTFISSLELNAYISEQGLHGIIHFSRNKTSNNFIIKTDLKETLEYPNQIWAWFIVEFPTDYSLIENRCDPSKLGKKLVPLHDTLGHLIIPDNKTSEFETDLTISGERGIFGKSLLLINQDTRRSTCATISLKDKTHEKRAVASFNTPLSGDIQFHWFFTKDSEREMLITADLYHVRNAEHINKTLVDFTEHVWKIYVTDILDTGSGGIDVNCNVLQLIFDPENVGKGSSIGDIDTRVGKLKISTDYNKRQYKILYRDDKLNLLPSDINGPQRRLFIVIFENKHPDSFLACAKIRYGRQVTSKVVLQSGGIKGDVILRQHNKFEPTLINFNLTTARGDLETKLIYSSSVTGYKIHELPISHSKKVGVVENACLTTKFIYNPKKIDVNSVPPNGFGTQEQYPIGDLSGKLLNRNNVSLLIATSQELTGEYWDVFLPLIGTHSIIQRSLVIYKNAQYSDSDITSEPWICGMITLYEPNFKYQKQIFTAQVIFRYPLVGRILFRQPKDEPWADTTMLVEYLVHADGSSLNNSVDHRWAIHDNPPGKDFYNWTARCLSAGPVYNPFKVDFTNHTPPENCNLNTLGVCRLGDLSTRQGMLDIAGKKVDSDRISRKMLTDPFLPLSGVHSILGRSFVIYDDFGPKARGERLACSIVGGLYRRKAVARDWFANGDKLSVNGKLEFFQQTEYDITNVEVNLEGLIDNSGYHIHMTPVEENLAFPCEVSSLYDHWNPLNVDPTSSPRTYHGTPDQYEMGDLSGKFGTLDNHTIYVAEYNDTQLPLFGPRSILGRSIIIHKRIVLKVTIIPRSQRYTQPAKTFLVESYFRNGTKVDGNWVYSFDAPMAEFQEEFSNVHIFMKRVVFSVYQEVVDQSKNQNRRWACSTIERGYSPSEARELRAIASFHHPSGFAYGYMRMTQLIYNDGSMSDTVIEVKLRHPGVNDRNITRDHNWAIFVNPVGVDAAVQTQATRCVAGGYVWNPYFTQLADPLNDELYRQECGPDNPLRCHVGDLSSRLGTIDIGLKRAVFQDTNFPLEGPVTAIGRSIVIMSPNRQPQRYACANLEPDYDIIKYANIEKPPRFVLAQFIEDIRKVMGIPEWMLTVDSRKTKLLHGNSCIQFLMHFKGPIANTLEQDFSKLLSTGRLESPSLYIPGYIDTKRKPKISYKQCGVRDPNEKKKSRSGRFGFGSSSATKLVTNAYALMVTIIIAFFTI